MDKKEKHEKPLLRIFFANLFDSNTTTMYGGMAMGGLITAVLGLVGVILYRLVVHVDEALPGGYGSALTTLCSTVVGIYGLLLGKRATERVVDKMKNGHKDEPGVD